MLKAAIYARKSTDDSDRAEDNKSVVRQVEHARRYAEAKGWIVEREHVYVDDGVSGAEFRNRPGLLRMLNSLKEFDVIVMSELSRLGRDMVHTTYALDGIKSQGVRVFFYLTDEEIKFDSAMDRFMLSALSLAAELEREKASQRSRDALLRKAEKGYCTGGRVFGYDNVPVSHPNQKGEQVKSHTDYRINEREADTVRRTFRMYAAGYGHVTIAKTLNGDPGYRDPSKEFFDGVSRPSPRGRTGSWAPSSVRAVLYNARYMGLIPFGEHRKVRSGGSANRRIKQSEFLQTRREDLRIIPEPLWQEVQARLQAVAKTYIEDTGGRRWGRPGMGTESKYLMTGLGRCSVCGANMMVSSRPSGSGTRRRTIHYYECSFHHNRGSRVCENAQRAHMGAVDEAVLGAVQRTALTPEAVDYVLDRALGLIAERQRKQRNLLPQLQEDIRSAQRKLNNFLVLIAEGNAPQAVMDQIRELEQRIEALKFERQSHLAILPGAQDLKVLRKGLHGRLSDLRELVYGNVPKARQALRKLLVGPVEFAPELEGERKYWRLRGQTTIGPLFDPIYLRMASPRGFEPRLPP